MKVKKGLKIVDVLIILLNLSAGRGNYLPYWLFHTPITGWILAIIIVIDILYLIFRFNDSLSFPKNITPVFFALFLLFYNFLNSLVRGGNYVGNFEYFILFFLFALILNHLFYELNNDEMQYDNRIIDFSKGYVWLSLISIIGVFLSFILLRLGLYSQKPVNADFLASNINVGTNYCISFFSINSLETSIRVPIFQDHGMLSGLFHEPHTLTFNTFPCLFILYGCYFHRKALRYIIIITGLLLILFTGSTTNIIALAVCLGLYFLVRARSNFGGTVVGIILLFVIIYYYNSFDNTLGETVASRVGSEGISQKYTRDLLRFEFTPKTFFGTDFFSTSYVGLTNHGQDVGVIPFILNICFLFYYIRNVFFLTKRGEFLGFTIALSSLYFILHSLKVGMTVYNQTLLIFLVYLQAIALNYGRVSTIKNNTFEGKGV